MIEKLINGFSIKNKDNEEVSIINRVEDSTSQEFTKIYVPLDKWGTVQKRILDIVISHFGMLLFLFLFPILGIIIKLESRGPILFRQERLGKNGKVFTMFKFRCMVDNAEEIKPSILDKNEVNGPMFKIRADPRLTKFGLFLRNRKLDELPQFWNILKGEMSLVGPRPLVDDEMRLNPHWRESRLCVKPGLTGLWQVENRDFRCFEEWIYWDTYYVENQSFALDLKIFVKTIVKVARWILPF